MDLELSSEQLALRNEAWTFARQDVAPSIQARETERRWDPELFTKMGDGLLGAWIPKEVGGRGLGALESLLMLEAFAEGSGDVGLATAYAVHSLLVAGSLVRFGDDVQKKRYLPKLVNAEWLFAFPLCELEAGLHPANASFRAVRSSEEWLLNGSKAMLINGPVASFALITAITDANGKPPQSTAFILDLRTIGVRVTPNATFPLRTCQVGDVECKDVKLPLHARLGPEHQAQATLLPFWQAVDRTLCMGAWLGVVGDLQQRCIEQLKAGTFMGKPAAQAQSLRHHLFALRLYFEQARAMLFRSAVALHRGGQPSAVEAAATKLFMMDVMQDTPRMAAAIFGMKTDPAVERANRLALTLGLLAGGRELLHTIVAATMLNIG